jgi:hypothetical protein
LSGGGDGQQQVITEFIAPKMSHMISFSTGHSLRSRHKKTPAATLVTVLKFAYRHAPPPAHAYTCRRGGGIPPGSGAGDP